MENQKPDISIEARLLISDKLQAFNNKRTIENGIYYILFPSSKSLYYTFWFYDTKSTYYPYIYLTSLDISAIASINKAMRIINNSDKPLYLIEKIDSQISHGDDIITFGKYRGKHLQDIYSIDPKYINWIAEKYEPQIKSEFRFKELAVMYNKVYLDIQVNKRYKKPVSNFIGKPGDKLNDLNLSITRIRIEDNSYKTQIIQGVENFYVDQLITATDSSGNLFLLTIKANDRSLTSRTLSPNARVFHLGERLIIYSAKVLRHIESHNIRYTKIGYIKFKTD